MKNQDSKQSFAVYAVKALEQYFALLLGVANVVAQDDAGREVRPALERAIRALRHLRKELPAIEIIEQRITRHERPVSS